MTEEIVTKHDLMVAVKDLYDLVKTSEERRQASEIEKETAEIELPQEQPRGNLWRRLWDFTGTRYSVYLMWAWYAVFIGLALIVASR